MGKINRLNARQVETLTKPGRHADGGNLYLFITPDGGKRWTFMYQSKGKQREMGLGGAGKGGVSLKDARVAAAEARTLLQAGSDPMAVRDAIRQARMAAERVVPTFGECADQYLEAHKGKFRSAKHIAQWRTTLTKECGPIRALPIDKIERDEVLGILTPLWKKTPETASRVRGRLEKILDNAKARGLRTGENPARWRGHLDTILPARDKLSRGHHAALPYAELPEFMVELRSREGLAAVALEFTILTVTRTTEARAARWDEFNLSEALWTIPKTRMKAGREHRVPLSARAVKILQSLPRMEGNPHVFPGHRTGKPLSPMSMAMLLKRMDKLDITVHGFRSAFRDWAAEKTNFPNEVCEAALAHTIGNRVEAAYRRGDMLEKRALLMAAWAQYCEPRTSAKVFTLKTKV